MRHLAEEFLQSLSAFMPPVPSSKRGVDVPDGQNLDPMLVPPWQGSLGTSLGLLVSIEVVWLCFSSCWEGIWMLRGQKD